MTVRVAINGFGRIGRLALRNIIENKRKDIEIVAINDLGSADINAHLLKYDSVHGTLNAEVSVNDKELIIDGKPIKVFAVKNPAELPWKDLKIDIVFECTGIFTSKQAASAHIQAGAKKVLISAPSSDPDITVVFGVNHKDLKAEHTVVSNASCTTNCLVPVAHVLHHKIGIVKGFCTTIHSYTGDQRIVDTMHADPRRARAAALSMIPTKTGAAKAVALVMPELKGKLDGSSIRVPTPNVSLVDFKFTSDKSTTVEEINSAITEAANGYLKGVLGVNTLPLVSMDFNHNPNSSTFDTTETKVIEGNFVRIVTWYDNEWGFSCRMADTALAMMNAK